MQTHGDIIIKRIIDALGPVKELRHPSEVPVQSGGVTNSHTKPCSKPRSAYPSQSLSQSQSHDRRLASILMPFVKRDEWHVILTQRPDTMPNHPGQIAFPGGKVEPGERAAAAALRETFEEIGVAAHNITLIGRWPAFDAAYDFRVAPFFGIINSDAQLIPDPHEVADIFEVPLRFLMNPNNHIQKTMSAGERDYPVTYMPYTSPDGTYRNIWGMTAMVMQRLSKRVFTANDFDAPLGW